MNSENEYDEQDFMNDEDEQREKRIIFLKRLGIGILITLGIIILFLLLKGCDKKPEVKDSLEDILLAAGKEYYEYNDYLLPDSAGVCSTVKLSELSQYGLLNPDEFNSCEKDSTYVKVCMLESKDYQWTPFLLCDGYDTESEFGSWTEGSENNLVTDKSDVRFLFLGQRLNLDNANVKGTEEIWKDEITYTNYKTLALTNYYSYRDKEYIWNIFEKYYYTSKGDKTKASDVNEYYTSSPKSGYTYKDSADSTVAKWYTVTGEKEFWLAANGSPDYWPVQPDTTKTNGVIYPYYTNGIDYYKTRTWTKTGTPTETNPVHMWLCSSETDSNKVTSYVECSKNTNNPNHTTTVKDFYTCDNGITEVAETGKCYVCSKDTLRDTKTECGTYSKYTFSKTKCTGASDLCDTNPTTFYQWYRIIGGETRSYYPSKSSSAAGEKIYYKTSPVSGAIKDSTTISTGYKWYKKVEGQTTKYYVNAPQEGATRTSTFKWTNWTNWSKTQPSSTSTREIKSRIKVKLQQITGITNEEWIDISSEYLPEDQMIAKFKELGFAVNKLQEINASGEIRYKLKLFYRNREVK